MFGIGGAVSYTVVGVVFCILIFLGAYVFVVVARRGNRRFKWRRAREADGEPAPSHPRDS
jgi:hypothetical protein